MAPDRIILIRHAEQHGAPGVVETGETDAHSLGVRGWQRAGASRGAWFHSTAEAISRLMSSLHLASARQRDATPATDLVAPRRAAAGYSLRHEPLKTDVDALMSDVLSRRGTVLVAWEHSMIPSCMAQLPVAPRVPKEWPQARYDLFWIFDRTNGRWSFAQRPQLLLAGDG